MKFRRIPIAPLRVLVFCRPVLFFSLVAASVFIRNGIAQGLPATYDSYYAAPNGTGLACTVTQPCSLGQAQETVRFVNQYMTRDIVVFLRGGTYRLSEPLTFLENANTHDSGSNGFTITWTAYPGETPVLNGGIQITGWSLYDASQNIYRAQAPAGLNARSLYVNGLRATRAQGFSGILSETDTGYLIDDSTGYNIATWKHPEDLEFTAINVWRFMRCGVASVSGQVLTMKEPCWSSATAHVTDTNPPSFTYPWWIENALELLDQPREWYLDQHEGWLYYKPSPDQDLSTAEVIVPIAESLLQVSGAAGTPIHDLQFLGMSFEYTTWYDPGGPAGYVGIQTGFTWRVASSPIWWGAATGPSGNNANAFEWSKTPGSIVVHYANSIVLANNVLAHLGNAGLNVEYGSRHTQIIGNLLYDISSTGIQVGDNESVPFQAQAGVPEMLTYDTLIQDNLITQTGAEFSDGAGIWAGYVDTLVIDHNEIFNIPWNGISLGWGWGIFDPTLAKNNQISATDVHNACMGLWECGSVYVMSAQPGSSIHDNYVHDQPTDHSGGLFYMDFGTQYFTIANNVAARAPPDGGPQTIGLAIGDFPSEVNNSVSGNFTDASYFGEYNYPGNEIVDNQENLASWPPEARQIITNAGLESSYAYLLGNFDLAVAQARTPVLTGISPSTLAAGASGTFTITGANTTFLQGNTTISPMDGITIGTITVTSPTTLTVHLAAAADAIPRPNSILAITGVEQATLLNGLVIQPVNIDLPLPIFIGGSRVAAATHYRLQP